MPAYTMGNPYYASVASGDVVGIRFIPSIDMQLTALGASVAYFDQTADIPLALYTDSGTELATATLPAGTVEPEVGGSRFVQLTTPVQLQAGQAYRIAGYYSTGTFFTASAPVTADPNVSFTTSYFDPYGDPLSFPQYNPEASVTAGPNFEFASTPAVPLPAAANAGVPLLVGIMAAGAWRSRQNRPGRRKSQAGA
ncbi:MAG: DUF4082 domain-containing protein [Phycisphaerae bacterium]